MKDRLQVALWQGAHGEYLGVVVGLDELRSTNPNLAVSGLDAMVLHTAGFIYRSTVNEAVLDRNRGGDVLHDPLMNRLS